MTSFFVYILLCQDNSYYIGFAYNVEKRFQQHLSGEGGRYTRSHKPINIIYKEEFSTKSEALKREIQLKKLNKKQKKELIEVQK